MKTDVTRPNATQLEISTACSAELAFSTVTIGPKTSSCASLARRLLAVDHGRA